MDNIQITHRPTIAWTAFDENGNPYSKEMYIDVEKVNDALERLKVNRYISCEIADISIKI